jgi:transcriptional regulator with XRE-family HTH domain
MFQRTSKREQARRQYRQWRVLVNLSQDDTAIKARIAKSRYWRIENGYREATAQEAARIAKVFGITPEQLIETGVP